MANRISEDLFQAIDVIVGQRIRSMEKDKTILCTIEDNSHAAEGKYTVSSAAARFDAFGQDTTYRVGQNVWVLIPDGEYSNDKIIISKYTKDDNSPYVWVDPLHSYANISGQAIQAYDFTEVENVYDGSILLRGAGLIANLSNPVDIITGQEVSLPNNTTLGEVMNSWVEEDKADGNSPHFYEVDGAAGLNMMGISAEFRTAFGQPAVLSGNYGLVFIVKTAIQSTTNVPGEDKFETEYRYIPFGFDTSDMWGDPYNFTGYFKQSTCYKIKPEENGTPVAIAGCFYQSNNFIGEDKTELPSQYTETKIVNGETVTTTYPLDPNIFVRNINVSFGYSVDQVEDDCVFFFTQDSLIYVVDNHDYEKRMQIRFVYVGDDGTRVAINNQEDYIKYATEDGESPIPALVEMHPVFRIYQEVWQTADEAEDPRAKGFWKEVAFFDPAEDADAFVYTTTNLTRTDYERFMCIVCCNNKYDEYKDATTEEELQQWAETDQLITNPNDKHIIEFKNQNNAWDEGRDLIQALQLKPAASDKSKGVFNIYEATFSANNQLINMADQYKPHTMSLTFWSAITQQDELDTAERIMWYIPKNSTMIKQPDPEKLRTNQVLLNTKTNNTLPSEVSAILSDQEKTLYNKYKSDYYIILDTSIADPEAETKDISSRNVEALLDYYIEPIYSKYKTHNTILASAYRYKQVYETKYELTFGARGANGTDYTLALTMVEELSELDKTYYDPPAWTWITGGSENTAKIKLRAQLYTPEDEEIEDSNVTYTWTIVAPTNRSTPNAIGYVPVTRDGNVVWKNTWQVENTGSNVWLTPVDGGLLKPADGDSSDGFGAYLGVVLRCTAKIKNTSTGTQHEKTLFSNYLVVPMRRFRRYKGMDGPYTIRYSSSGTNPQFYDAPYGLIDSKGKISYTYTEETPYTITLHTNQNMTGITPGTGQTYAGIIGAYYPEIKQRKTDDLMHLEPKAMYFNDVKYVGYVRFAVGNGYHWAQPILVQMDPYGSSFLNNWGGAIDIDYTNNTIMSSVMGAGKKETDNTFTGILMGDLPQTVSTKKSGIVGYEHGDMYYQLYDDGTMTLGKSSRAQLKFDGSNSTIQNAGYRPENGGTGILIDFEGTNGNQKPYIDIKANSGADFRQIKIGTSDPYFMIKVGTGADTTTELFHVGPNQFYLQTADYVANTSGVRLDLKNASFVSNGSLTIRGGASTATNGFIYLSTSNRSDTVAGTTTTNWRLIVGNQFGVTASGKLYASGASIGGSSTISDDSVIGGRTVSQLKAQADEAHVDAYTLMNTAYVQQLVNNTVGGWHIWHANTVTAQKYTTTSSGAITTTTVGTVTYAGKGGSIYGFAHTSNDTYGGSLTHFIGSGLSASTYKFNGTSLNDTWTLYMNGNFGVTTSGKLYATGAYIQGGGEFTGTITASAGNIGGWEISQDYLRSSNATYSASKGMILQPAAGDWALAIGADNYNNHGNAPFRVDHYGNLYANKGYLSGDLKVAAATISGKLTADQIDASALTVTSIDASAITSGTLAAERIGAKTITTGMLSTTNFKLGASYISTVTFTAVTDVTLESTATGNSLDVRLISGSAARIAQREFWLVCTTKTVSLLGTGDTGTIDHSATGKYTIGITTI